MHCARARVRKKTSRKSSSPAPLQSRPEVTLAICKYNHFPAAPRAVIYIHIYTREHRNPPQPRIYQANLPLGRAEWASSRSDRLFNYRAARSRVCMREFLLNSESSAPRVSRAAAAAAEQFRSVREHSFSSPPPSATV